MNAGGPAAQAPPLSVHQLPAPPRLCVNCRHSYQTPRTGRVYYPSLIGCRRFYAIDLVTGEPVFHSAYDMRGSGRACGPAGHLFEGRQGASGRDGLFSLLD